MIALAFALSVFAAPDAQTLSVQDCVRIALEKNADVLGADFSVDAAKAARASMAGNYGPRLRVEGNYLRYPEEQTVSFSPPGAPTPTPPTGPKPGTPRPERNRAVEGAVSEPVGVGCGLGRRQRAGRLHFNQLRPTTDAGCTRRPTNVGLYLDDARPMIRAR